MAAGESSPLREALSISTETSWQGVGNLWCLEAVDPHKDASSVSIIDSLSVKFQLSQQPNAKAPWPGGSLLGEYWWLLMSRQVGLLKQKSRLKKACSVGVTL